MASLKLFWQSPSNQNFLFANMLLGSPCLTFACIAQEDHEKEKKASLQVVYPTFQHHNSNFPLNISSIEFGQHKAFNLPETTLQTLHHVGEDGQPDYEEGSEHFVHILEILQNDASYLEELQTVRSERGSLDSSFTFDDEDSIVIDL